MTAATTPAVVRAAGGTRDGSAGRAGGALPALAVGPVLVAAAAKLAIQLVFLTGYGWHRDELYYLVGGRHLDAGYVDHPLLAPWVARGVDLLFGPSLAALRVVPAVIGAGLVVLTALLARELGGGRRAQVVAAVCVALDPFVLGANHLFQTVTFDQLAWLLVALSLARLLRTEDPRWWVAVGGATAFGILAKVTIVVWVGALAIGLVATPARRLARSWWCAAGAGLVVLGALPFLWFQVRHGWAFAEFSRHLNDATAGGSRPQFLPAQLLLHDPVSVLVWIPGLVALLRGERMRRFRVFGWAFVAAALVFLVTGAKHYYLAPAFPVLFAAGAAALEPRWRTTPKLLLAGLVAGSVLAWPVALPVLPVETVADSPVAGLNRDAFEQVGWPELVRTVERVARGTDGPVVVVTSNYGESSALDALGHDHLSVRGRQNSAWLWGRDPVPADDTTFVVVGLRPGEVRRSFTGCDEVARVDNRYGIDNDERGVRVRRCAGLAGPWAEVWSNLRWYR